MILNAIVEKLKRRSKDDCRVEVPVTYAALVLATAVMWLEAS